MIDGGQQLTGIDTHLQMGSELFDADPKGALAAYYQAVSLDASHIEGWNQIGRLMFDLEQYSEAEMVFKRVESLANEQNLPDWAEMAAQNIDLAQQSIGAQDAMAPIVEDGASEETKSIEDISNIAAVAQIPQTAGQAEDVLVPDVMVAEVAQPVGIQIPAVDAAPMVMPVPEIAPIPEITPIAEIAPVPVIAALPEVAPVPEIVPVPEFAPVPEVAPVPEIAPMPELALAPEVAPAIYAAPPIPPQIPVQPDPASTVGAITMPPAIGSAPLPSFDSLQASPVAPAPAMPYPEVPSVGIQPAVSHAPPPPPPLPEMAAVVADPLTTPPVPNLGQLQEQYQAPPPAPFPTTPFPLQPEAQKHATPIPPIANVPQPETALPGVDAEMEAPKSRSGKLALMITGVVGAAGIGLGVAQYFNVPGLENGSVPVIKSEAKLGPKIVSNAQLAAVPAGPTEMGRDQAYKVGMTHLVKEEYDDARRFLEQAEAKGHAEAGYNLAALYAKGNGVEKNFEKAVAYLRKSAEGGYYPSMTNLGLLYANGDGVEQNYLTARSHWLKAAAGEHPDAMHNLAVIYATGKGVDKDMGEAIKWYRKAANAGYIDSIANLGLLYATGDGVALDYDEAKRLWKVAAAKGHKSATDNLAKLEQVMPK